ncbi:hypothetical protein EHS39_00155 [Ensifer sp. MPMI2T]|nr:hypothetical protein EHS39_00155 [Ensifer sp. MPMI2T]
MFEETGGEKRWAASNSSGLYASRKGAIRIRDSHLPAPGQTYCMIPQSGIGLRIKSCSDSKCYSVLCASRKTRGAVDHDDLG